MMKQYLKQTGIILGCSMLLCIQSCKEKTQTAETTATTETVETVETIEDLSKKAKEKQIEKLKEEEASIALAKAEKEEKERLEAEAIKNQAALEKERLDAEEQARKDSIALAESERKNLDIIEKARKDSITAANKERDRIKAEKYANRPCRPKKIRSVSDASWVEFRLPEGKKNKSIHIKSGQYSVYRWGRCNRVIWTDLLFECDERSRVWRKVTGGYGADGLCHGSKGNSPYVFVGAR